MRAIEKIRKKILINGGKGREARASVGAEGFANLGKSELHQEIAEDVAALIYGGTRPGKAFQQVAEVSDESVDNVKKIYQRVKAVTQRDIEKAAKEAGVRPSEILGQLRPQNKA